MRRNDKRTEQSESVASPAPGQKRPKNRQHDAVASPLRSGFDLDQRGQIDNPNPALRIAYEFGVAYEVGVLATVVQATEHIERTEVGNQPYLATGLQQGSIGAQIAAAGLPNQGVEPLKTPMQTADVSRGDPVDDVKVLRGHRSAVEHRGGAADNQVLHSVGVQRVEQSKRITGLELPHDPALRTAPSSHWLGGAPTETR